MAGRFGQDDVRQAAAKLVMRPAWALAADEQVLRVAQAEPDALLAFAELLAFECAPPVERNARRIVDELVDGEVRGWPVPMDQLTGEEAERLAVLLALAAVQRLDALPPETQGAICAVMARAEALVAKLEEVLARIEADVSRNVP